MSLIRLQRFLAQAGVASRRKAEELITAGRVRVNGEVVTELGTKVEADRDRVTIDERELAAERKVYYLLHKPKGYVTTAQDPEGRQTIFALLPGIKERVYPVGRLDYLTEGVLLLTNDGDLAHALMHPSKEIAKTYWVKLHGLADEKALRAFEEGLVLDDGERTSAAHISGVGSTGKNTWIELTIHEGKNRQIHRMAEAVGYQVLKLKRVRYAGIELGSLKVGESRALVQREVAALYQLTGLGRPQPAERRPPHERPRPHTRHGRRAAKRRPRH